MQNNGIFITISGLDGSGKTTVQNKIQKLLSELSKKEILCVDGLKPLRYTNVLRNYAAKEKKDVFELFGEISLFSFALSLIDNYVNAIKPALEQGKIVISHRNDMCCKAYTQLRDYDNKVMPILTELLKVYPKADLHLYCVADVDTVMKRIEMRTKSGYVPSINEDYEHLICIQKNYDILLMEQYSYVEVIDTSGSNKGMLDQTLCNILTEKIGSRL